MDAASRLFVVLTVPQLCRKPGGASAVASLLGLASPLLAVIVAVFCWNSSLAQHLWPEIDSTSRVGVGSIIAVWQLHRLQKRQKAKRVNVIEFGRAQIDAFRKRKTSGRYRATIV